MSFKLSQIQPRAAELAQLSCTLALVHLVSLKYGLSWHPSVHRSLHLSTFSDMNIINTRKSTVIKLFCSYLLSIEVGVICCLMLNGIVIIVDCGGLATSNKEERAS